MIKQLQHEEIQKLFDFVESKYVRYEDLKYELVDHLASSIEQIQANDSKTSFDEALKETYGRFPITGFTHFVSDKHNSLTKYWNRFLWKNFIEYFKLPKIILLCTLSYLLFTLFHYVPHAYIIIFVIIMASLSSLLNIARFISNRKNKNKYLFLESYNSVTMGNSFGLIYIPIHFFAGNNPITNFMDITIHPYAIIVISIMLSLSLIVSHITLNVMPDILKQEVNTKYAHLNIKLAI